MSFLLTSNIYYLARAADFTFQIFLNFIMSTPPSQTALIHIFSTTEIVQYEVSLTVLSVFQIAVKVTKLPCKSSFCYKTQNCPEKKVQAPSNRRRAFHNLALAYLSSFTSFYSLNTPWSFLSQYLSSSVLSGKNDLFLPTSYLSFKIQESHPPGNL